MSCFNASVPRTTKLCSAWRNTHLVAYVLSLLCISQIALAHEVDELASDQISVRELMRLETAQALKRLRPEGASHAGTSRIKHAGSSPDQGFSAARLVAIYGVGTRLMAELDVDGQILLFMRGRPEAVGPGRKHAMRLVDMTSRCVEVSMGGQRESLCADRATLGAG